MGALNEKYIEAIGILEESRKAIEEFLESSPGIDGDENFEAYSSLENIEDRLRSARDFLDYLSKPAKEGILIEDKTREKFFIRYEDNTESHLLSSGNSLELFNDEYWSMGRVEHKEGKYYFNRGEEPFLEEGMKVRKRQI